MTTKGSKKQTSFLLRMHVENNGTMHMHCWSCAQTLRKLQGGTKFMDEQRVWVELAEHPLLPMEVG